MKKRQKIEKGSPDYSLKRSQHLGRNNGSYCVGCIMKTVDIVKNQGQYNDGDE